METIKREKGAGHVRLPLPLFAGPAVINHAKRQQYHRGLRRRLRVLESYNKLEELRSIKESAIWNFDGPGPTESKEGVLQGL